MKGMKDQISVKELTAGLKQKDLNFFVRVGENKIYDSKLTRLSRVLKPSDQ